MALHQILSLLLLCVSLTQALNAYQFERNVCDDCISFDFLFDIIDVPEDDEDDFLKTYEVGDRVRGYFSFDPDRFLADDGQAIFTFPAADMAFYNDRETVKEEQAQKAKGLRIANGPDQPDNGTRNTSFGFLFTPKETPFYLLLSVIYDLEGDNPFPTDQSPPKVRQNITMWIGGVAEGIDLLNFTSQDLSPAFIRGTGYPSQFGLTSSPNVAAAVGWTVLGFLLCCGCLHAIIGLAVFGARRRRIKARRGSVDYNTVELAKPPSISMYESNAVTLASFLEGLGLSKYLVVFQKEDIDMDTLKQLPEMELERIGIPLGARYRIFGGLKRKTMNAKASNQVYLTGIKIGEKVGRGAFGEVFKGLWNNLPVALKGLSNVAQVEEFTAEADLLMALRHPHIISFFGLFASPEGDQFIVMEFMPLGNLREFLSSKEGALLQLSDLLHMICQTASGMCFLSDQNILHRDLAARNLLVKKENDRYTIKITDFGMSRETQTSYYVSANRKIPIKWTALEGVKFGKFSASSDVWSFGVVMWEIFERGSEPYPALDNQEVVEKVGSGYRMAQPKDCSDELYEMMLSCWNEVPEARPTFHSMFAQLEKVPGIPPMDVQNGESKEEKGGAQLYANAPVSSLYNLSPALLPN